MHLLRDLVQNESVALVGNAASIFGKLDGEMIDDHSIVIRMNAGYPSLLGRLQDTGRRTDVWAAAKPFYGPPQDTRLAIFMKLTPLGDSHWPMMQAACKQANVPCIRWSHELEMECQQFVGAPPGTGIRMLWWLKTYANPVRVSVYGMDCWKTTTHWSGKRPTANHSPDLEASAMARLME